jgi:hypothetical protein
MNMHIICSLDFCWQKPFFAYSETPHLRFLWGAADLNKKLTKILNGGHLTMITDLKLNIKEGKQITEHLNLTAV